MMAMTLAGLRVQCRSFLHSDAIWPDAMLNAFINDAIRAYSNDFPRRLVTELALETGVQAYDLPGGHGFMRLRWVVYPSVAMPSRFLYRDELDGVRFAAGGAVYGLRAAPADRDDIAGQIVFAEPVATGEMAALGYSAVHDAVSDDEDVVTVPESHLEALIAFVDFRAHWERESTETYSASSSSLILSQLGENGRRTWNRWRELMTRLQRVDGEVGRMVWGDIGL